MELLPEISQDLLRINLEGISKKSSGRISVNSRGGFFEGNAEGVIEGTPGKTLNRSPPKILEKFLS